MTGEAQKIESEQVPAKKENGWEGFKAAVEDPNADVYDYLKGSVARSLGISGAKDLGDLLARGRDSALHEIEDLGDIHKVRDKLASLESNPLLIDPVSRSGVKICRVVLDAYIVAHDHEDGLKDEDAATARAREKLAEAAADKDIAELSAMFKGRSEEEIRETVREAVRQLGSENTVKKMTADIIHFLHINEIGRFLKEIMKPAYVAQIGAVSLAFVSPTYLLTVAVSLLLYSSQRAFVHGFRGIGKLVRGRGDEAREEGRMAVAALKSATGTFLLTCLSPFTSAFPKAAQGYANMVIESTHNSLMKLVEDMFRREEKKPGSTPLSRRISSAIKSFLGTYQDGIATETAKLAATMSASEDAAQTVTKTARVLPLSRIKMIAGEVRDLGQALRNRFSNAAAPAVPLAPEETAKINKVRTDFAEAGRSVSQAMAERKRVNPVLEALKNWF